MEFNIVPYSNVGPLYFSSTREEIRSILEEPFEEGIKEFMNLKSWYDLYMDTGLFVYYKESGKIEAFEFFKPVVYFEGFDLLNTPTDILLDFFAKKDPNIKIDEDAFLQSDTLGICIGYKYDEDDYKDQLYESVVIYNDKDYYNNLPAF